MSPSLALFALTAAVAVASPGPTTLLAAHHGARLGLRAAMPGVAGAVLSDVVLIAATAAGLSAVLQRSPLAFEVLRWLGAAYLGWLGCTLLRQPLRASAGNAGTDMSVARETAGRVLRRSFMVAVTNPKGYLFFGALLPAFIDTGAALPRQYLVLTVVFTAIDAVVLSCYAAAGAIGLGRRRGAVARRRFEQASGAALLAMGGALLLWRGQGV
jgi:threonine/homoserine/homoserine lactone efflux protein